MNNQIQQYLNDCKWEQAIAVLELEEENEETLSLLGWAYSRNGNYKYAINCFDKLIKIQPNAAKWYYMKGYQYYSEKNYKESIVWFEKALSIFPDYFIVKYRIAYAFLQECGNFKQYTKVEFWKAVHHLHECLNLYEEFDESKKEKEKGTYFDICFLYGKAIQDMDSKRKNAIKLFKRALTIKKDNICQYQLAKTYYLEENYDEALKNLPKVKDYYVKELNASILAAMGEYQSSNKILLKLSLYRKKDYVFHALATNYIQLGDLNSALEYAESAVKFGRYNHKNHLLLGDILYKKGEYIKAKNHLEKACEIRKSKYNIGYPEAEKIIDDINAMAIKEEKNLEDNSLKTYTGKIIKFIDKKGYGFIEYNDTTIFFHYTNIDGEIDKSIIGKEVNFNIEQGRKGDIAVNIRLV